MTEVFCTVYDLVGIKKILAGAIEIQKENSWSN